MQLCYTHVLLTTKGSYDESDFKTMRRCKKKSTNNFLKKNHEKRPLVFHQLNQPLCMDGEDEAISVPFQNNWAKSLTLLPITIYLKEKVQFTPLNYRQSLDNPLNYNLVQFTP